MRFRRYIAISASLRANNVDALLRKIREIKEKITSRTEVVLIHRVIPIGKVKDCGFNPT